MHACARLQGAQGDGAQGARSGLSDLFARQKVSQRFGGEAPRPTQHGGDEDLPRRAPLHERRAQFDAKVARKAARSAEALAGACARQGACVCMCVCRHAYKCNRLYLLWCHSPCLNFIHPVRAKLNG